MASTDDLEAGPLRAADDQRRAVQRRGATRSPQPATSRRPTLHYVRSNFALPAHDGTLEIGGAVEQPATLTLDDLRALPAVERAVTLECAGNGRLEMRPLPTGEPWGDYAVSTARWTGARLSDVLAQVRPAAGGVDVRFEGADQRPVPPHLDPRRHRPGRRDVRAGPAALDRRRPCRGDPHRLRDERRTAPTRPRRPVPAHRAALVRRRLRQVAAPHRRAHRAVRRRVPDRPLHLRVARPPPRTRHPHARPSPHHRPRTRRRAPPRHAHDPRQGLVRHRPHHRRRGQLHRRRRLAPGRTRSRPPGPTTGRTGPSTGNPPTSAATPSAPEPPTPPATSNPKSHRGTGSATATTPSKSSTSTCGERTIPRRRSGLRGDQPAAGCCSGVAMYQSWPSWSPRPYSRCP